MIMGGHEIKEIYSKYINNKESDIVDFYKKFLEDIINNPLIYSIELEKCGIEEATKRRIDNMQDTVFFNRIFYDIVERYLFEIGYRFLNKERYQLRESNLMHLFVSGNYTICMIKQLQEDNIPDLVSKQVLIKNFISDIKYIENKHEDCTVAPVLWFIGNKRQNEEYFLSEYKNIRSRFTVCYGEELFINLLRQEYEWKEIMDQLRLNPLYEIEEEMNVLNFDTDEIILQALQDIDDKIFKKLMLDVPVYIKIREILFPDNINLNKIKAIKNIK